MADKEISLKINIEGVGNEASELAKLEVQLKNLNEERRKFLQKVSAKGIISNEDKLILAAYDRDVKKTTESIKGLKKVVDSAPDSLNRMRQKLIEMKNEYANASEAARNKMAPAINKLNDEVSKAEKAIGVHSRGVGNYKGGIMAAAKELLGFAGITAVAATALNQLKTAFFETELGARSMKQWGEGLRTFFQSVLGGADAAGAVRNAAVAMDVAKKMDELRKGDRQDLIEIAKLEGELNQLKIQAADVTKTTTEQLALQNQVSQKENDILQFKIKDKQEELDILNQLIAVRPEDTKLLDQQAQLQAEIINLQNDQSLRIASKLAALREKEFNEKQKLSQDELKNLEAFMDATEQANQENEKRRKEAFEEELKDYEETKKKELEAFTAFMRATDDTNQERIEREKEQNRKAYDDEVKAYKEKEDRKKEVADAAAQGVQEGVQASFDFKRAKLQAEMEAELSNANLTEAQRDAIRKKYAREQQKIDVKQALANGAAAIIKNIAQLGFLAAIPINLLTAIQTGIQVATIKAQKYETGGKINKGVPIYIPGSKDNLLIAANNKEAVVNERQIAALGGTRAMKAAGVPGFAEGGAIGNMPYINPAVPPTSNDIQEMRADIRSLEVRLDMHKVRNAMNELDVTLQHQRI